MKKGRAKADVFMPLYVGDYFADTMELDAEGHGAYLMLLMSAWRRGGRLPTDPMQLAGMARVKPKRWQHVWGLIARFFQVDGDCYIQPRLSRELSSVADKLESAKASGKRGAQKRWGGQSSWECECADPDNNPTENKDGETIGSLSKNVSDHGSSQNQSQNQRIPSEGDPPKPPLVSADGWDLHADRLIHLLRVEIEKLHPELGFWQPGRWGADTARRFLETIPADKRTAATREEIRRRARSFAASTDKRITRGKWEVEDFCRAFNELASKAVAAEDATERAVRAMAERIEARSAS